MIKKIQALYILTIVAAVAYTAACLSNVVPTDFITLSPEWQYAVELLILITGIGSTFLALKLFALNLVKKELKQSFDAAYKKWAYLRQVMISLALFVCLFVYFSCPNVTSSQYIILILLIGFVFCWPSEKEYKELQENVKG